MTNPDLSIETLERLLKTAYLVVDFDADPKVCEWRCDCGFTRHCAVIAMDASANQFMLTETDAARIRAEAFEEAAKMAESFNVHSTQFKAEADYPFRIAAALRERAKETR